MLPLQLLEQLSVLTQTVTPHKDFFTAQFLLAFPRGGQYLLVVEASVVDEQTNTWKTGPRSSLTVKVPEEAKLTPISVPGMANNANVLVFPLGTSWEVAGSTAMVIKKYVFNICFIHK